MSASCVAGASGGGGVPALAAGAEGEAPAAFCELAHRLSASGENGASHRTPVCVSVEGKCQLPGSGWMLASCGFVLLT